MAHYAPIQDLSYDSQLSPKGGTPHQEEHSADVGDASMGVPELAIYHDQENTVSIELEEVERSWNDAALLTAKSSRVPSGSGGTLGKGASPFAAVRPLQGATPSLKSSNEGSGSSRAWYKDGTWTIEIVTMFVSLAALAAIIGLIAHYDRRSLYEWPYRLTLNTAIAVLATMSVTTLGISLQNGLSQIKWIRFKESKVPLSDMETFDEASRGVVGAIKLLASRRGGLLGSAGAIIAILTLAFSPFSQQIVTYELRAVNHPQNATIPRALNFTGALPGTTSPTGYVPVLPLKSAVYNGLFAENGRPAASLKFDCQTGNCTWPVFDTLGVCYECVPLTSVLTKYCGGNPANASDCGWQVPQGAKLNDSRQVFSMTPYIPSAAGDMPYSTILRLIFMGTEAADGPAGNSSPWAKQCSLSACLQTINATVSVGALTENVTHTVVNQTVIDTTTQPSGTDLGVYVTDKNNTTPSSASYYLLGQDSMLSLRGWFTSVFAAGGATRTTNNSTITINDRTVAVNLTVGISNGTTFFDSDIVTAFYWNYYEYAQPGQDGLAMLMADVATSVTVAFRSLWGAEPVHGPAVSTESYIHVRWGFLVLPVLVVLGADLFLVGAIYQTQKTRTRPLKSSALAMLFHGLADDTRARFGSTDSLQEKKKQAKKFRVQLDESYDRGSVLRG
ncbi:Carboxylic ester hydrolase [Apiospora aurea]|uniref:Carboxylic ester hydrolase n=1 Tax=Apiospora aurea TaxID=335848 RepID=A0ABR1PWA0_9PEZI